MSWEVNDAVNLRKYVVDNPKFFKELESRRPKTQGTTVEEAALTGMKRQGADDIIESIRDMMRDPVRNPDKAGFIS